MKLTKAEVLKYIKTKYPEDRIITVSSDEDTKLDDLSFKDAKDYVYKLAKYGVDCVESLKKRGKQAEIEFL